MYDLGFLQEFNPDDIQTALDNLSPQFESEGRTTPTTSSRSRGRAA